MSLLDKIFKKDSNSFKLSKESTGDWVVRKGSHILYIGTKEKCEIFMSQGLI